MKKKNACGAMKRCRRFYLEKRKKMKDLVNEFNQIFRGEN